METAETSTQETNTQSTPEVFDTQAQATEATPASWMWGESLVGDGEKPEWFKDSKYKSVAEQAKAYTELEKRFGGFVGAPQEGYQLAEELSSLSDDPSVKSVLDILKESNASNDLANKLIGTYMESQKQLAEQAIAREMELLGDNRDYRINAIKEFANANIPQNLQEAFAGMVTSASHIEVIESLMKRMQGSAVAPENTTPKSTVSSESLREMMFKTNENGQLLSSIDPEYKRKVDKAYADFYGA